MKHKFVEVYICKVDFDIFQPFAGNTQSMLGNKTRNGNSMLGTLSFINLLY